MASTAPTPKPVNGHTPTPITSAKVSRIGAIKRGQLRSELRFLFYGLEGVGKSSLAADAPAPLFIDVEGGADNIDAARYMFRDEDGGHVPRSYADVTAAISDLIANPGHGFKTLVIDTIDALEAFVQRHVCEVNGETSIEKVGGGFGKGYTIAVDEFRRFLRLLDDLRAKGMQIVLLGHSIVKPFKNPEGEDFERYQLRVNDKAGGLIKEWCDVVGFVRFEGGSAKLKGDASQAKRARGWATGKRVVHLAHDAAYDAKSRLSLPADVELAPVNPWAPFAQAGARSSTTDTLLADITSELDRIGVEQFTTAAGRATSRTDILAMVAKSDASTLTRVLAGLKATNPAQES